MVDSLLSSLERGPRPAGADGARARPGRTASSRCTGRALVDDPGASARRCSRALAEIARRRCRSSSPCIRARERTSTRFGLHDDASGLRLVEPLGYLDCLRLEAEATLVLTDSGGIQEETTVLGVPCLTLRENTERPITVTEGTNQLVGSDPDRIRRVAARGHGASRRSLVALHLWDGHTAERIAAILAEGTAVECGPPVRRPPPQHGRPTDERGRSSRPRASSSDSRRGHRAAPGTARASGRCSTASAAEADVGAAGALPDPRARVQRGEGDRRHPRRAHRRHAPARPAGRRRRPVHRRDRIHRARGRARSCSSAGPTRNPDEPRPARPASSTAMTLEWDAIVMVDADSIIERGFFDECEAALGGRREALQGRSEAAIGHQPARSGGLASFAMQGVLMPAGREPPAPARPPAGYRHGPDPAHRAAVRVPGRGVGGPLVQPRPVPRRHPARARGARRGCDR